MKKRTFTHEVLKPVPNHIAERMFEALDKKKSGHITFKEYLIGIVIFQTGTPEEKSQLVFEIYDIKSEGYVSREDMFTIFKEDVIMPVDEKRTIAQILDDCFEKADTDQDGKLSLAELQEWATQNRDLTSLTRWVFLEPAHKASASPQSLAKSTRADLLRSSTTLANSIHFDEKEVKDLERIFREISSGSGHGRMDKKALSKVFPPEMPQFLLDRIFTAFDDNLDGFIDSKEFICGLSPFCKGTEAEKLEFWFKIFDSDRDGHLSRAEMLSMVSAVWKVAALKHSIEDDSDSDSDSESTEKQEARRREQASMLILVQEAFQQFEIDPQSGKISADQYKTWVTQNPVALQFLDAIQRMSNIYFGLKPDTPEEEREIVEELQQASGPMQEGDVYYVINAKWWKLWCEQVGMTDSAAAEEGEERESGGASARRQARGRVSRLGPIDNTVLLTKKSMKPIVIKKGVTIARFPQLRPNMRLNDHFAVLPARVWGVLYNWYGGAPVLPRRVILAGDGEHSVLQVELHPYVVEIELRRSKEHHQRPLEFTFSRKSTVAMVRSEVCRHWHLDPTRVQLWNFYERNRPLLLTDQEQSLEDAGIVHEQRLVAETQSADGTWPLDSLPTVADDTPVTPGLVGLNNLGNTCFMNSALQCLSNTPPLCDYFISGSYLFEVNKVNPLGYRGEVAHTFGEVLQQLWVGDPKKGRLFPSYPPRQFKRIFSKHKPDFEGFEQHDASELLAELLDALHEDLNRVIEKPSVPPVESEGRPDAEVAIESWEAHLRRNQSVIVDVFRGQLRSSLKCPTCQKSSTTFDPFDMLSLPLPPEKERPITVRLMWDDKRRSPVEYGVYISVDAKMHELKHAVSKLCGLHPRQLVFAEVAGHHFFKFYSNFTPLGQLRPNAVVLAYEVRGPSNGGRAGRRRRRHAKSSSSKPAAAAASSLKQSSPTAAAESAADAEPDAAASAKQDAHMEKVWRRMRSSTANATEDGKKKKKKKSSGGKKRKSNQEQSTEDTKQMLDGPENKLKEKESNEKESKAPSPPVPVEAQLEVVAASSSGTSAEKANVSSSSQKQKKHAKKGEQAEVSRPAAAAASTTTTAATANTAAAAAAVKEKAEAEEEDDPENLIHVSVTHRYLSKLEVYFLNPWSVTRFGEPFLLCLGPKERTYDGVMASIWRQIEHRIKTPPVTLLPEELAELSAEQASEQLKTLQADSDRRYLEELRANPPFSLRVVNRDATSCQSCPWYTYCMGCPLLPTSTQVRDGQTIAVEWDRKLLSKYYDSSWSAKCVGHESVAQAREQASAPIDFADCMHLFTTRERLGADELWYCSTCEDFRAAEKKLDIWKLPPAFIVHLKRFKYNGFHFSKLSKLVRFPVTEELDMSQYVSGPNDTPTKYRLYGVLNHFGGLGSGHYIAQARNKDDGYWYQFDDSRCFKTVPENLVTPAAYVLFYGRADLFDLDLKPETEGDVPPFEWTKTRNRRCHFM